MADRSFKKLTAFTDPHFGEHSNSFEHNQRIIDFISWFIDESLTFGADTVVMLGDWHNSRRTINVSTLNYSNQGLRMLSAAFKNVYLIPGNHDLFLKHKRDIISLEFSKNIPNLHLVSEITEVGSDLVILPWLVPGEDKLVESLKNRYMFGHLELGGFLMNAMVKMPDNYGPDRKIFKQQEHVFSGHFHKRQTQGNITYIGNAFPINFSDSGDDDRGMMFLEWGKDPKYKSWPAAPKYRTATLSQIVEKPDAWLDELTSIRVMIDLDLDYEQAIAFKEQVIENYKVMDMILIPRDEDDCELIYEEGKEFQSVDQIVIEGLKAWETTGNIDRDLLIEIYNGLNVEKHG